MIENLFDTYALKANQEMEALYEFYREHKTDLINYYSDLDFLADRGYSLEYIAVKESGKLYAVFNIFYWEASGLYELDIESGFDKEISKMKKFLLLEQEAKARRIELNRAKRKEQYETLRKEFE